jgi:suppressor of fused protein SUFU
MSDQEFSASGSPVYRYDNATPKGFVPAFGDEKNIELISAHIEKTVGKADMVFHEIVSDKVHVDVHWVSPTEKFPFHVLVTSGMSDKPMTVPEGLDEYRYAELCILLPANWPLSEESFKDENNYWPIRTMKFLARFPHELDTWIGHGHTIPNGADAAPFADNTKFGCVILMPSISLSEDFFKLKVDENKEIYFYCLYPLYKEEMEYKLTKGFDALIDKFEKYRINDVVDLNRKNTCLKKGFLGLLG